MASALAPLRLPGFPNLGLAYLVNELGNWLGEIALAILVYDQTNSPIATAGLFCAMHFAPALLAPPLVSRVESLPVRLVLPGLYAAEAVVFVCLAMIVDSFALAAVLALAVLDGSLASAARALTRAAATSVLAPAGCLREGNALLNVAFTVGAAGGPAIAGLVVAGAGVETALLADAASFMAVAALLAVARRLELPETEEPEAPWADRFRRGLAYVRERTTLRRLLGAQALAFVFFSLVIPIEVVFAKETLDAGDAGYGGLLASWGAGMVVGSLAFAALRRVPLRGLLFASTLAIGLAYLGTAVSPTLAVACAASFVGGLGNGVQWIGLVTAVQELTRAAYQARVLSLLEALASAMPGIGFLAGGAIAAIFEPRLAYAVAGLGVVCVLVAAAALLRRAPWSPELEQGRAGGARVRLGRRGQHAVAVNVWGRQMRKKEPRPADPRPPRGSVDSAAHLRDLDREITRKEHEIRAAKAAARESRPQAGAGGTDGATGDNEGSIGPAPGASAAQPREQVAELDLALLQARGARWVEALEHHSRGAREHAEGTASYAFATAVEIGFDRAQSEAVRGAAMLHEAGYQLARRAGIPEHICGWLLRLRERYDGAGPEGLPGEAIPIESRIIRAACVCQTALAEPAGPDQQHYGRVVQELNARSGGQLDPRVVAALVSLIERASPVE